MHGCSLTPHLTGLLFIYQIGGHDLEVTVELSNSFSLSSSLTWSIWSKVTLGITYLWMWELVNHFIIFRSRQTDQDHRPLCACKASHSSEFSSGISAEIIQCVCTKIYSRVHEFTIVCKHAKVTSAVSQLDKHKNPICFRTHSTTASSWAPSLHPKKGTLGTTVRKCPLTGIYCSFNIMRPSLNQVLLNSLRFGDE